MDTKTLREFFEDNAIGIKKFLEQNFDVAFLEKKNARGRRWKISHAEISVLPLIAPISVVFSEKYIELVRLGKIVVVEDEFKKHQTYVNPRLIKEMMNEPYWQERLSYAQSDEEIKYVSSKIADIEETKRILIHFGCDNVVDYIESLGKVRRRGL